LKARFLFITFLLSLIALGETVKDREGAVRKDRAVMEGDPRWIYNDFERGFSEARRTGKPLLVVLRCVPCLACAGLDAGVLEEPALTALLDQFVCVRLINANALDLKLFQFDYDLSFSTLFFNGDGTVYARYGSWTHQKDPLDKATSGFRHTLDAVLALHKAYPANKAELAGKQGGTPRFKSTLEIPSLASNYTRQLEWDGRLVQSCVHCHQIGDASRAALRDQNEPIPDELIYPWPSPDLLGLNFAADRILRVESVARGSAGEAAGLIQGDEIVSFTSQPLVSIADLSWVLHRAQKADSLPMIIRRGDVEKPLTIVLPEGWRNKADISKRVGTWTMRGMALGGLVLEDLPDAERVRRHLTEAGTGLLVKYVGEYNKHAAGKKAGFKKDDVIVEVEGVAGRVGEGELIGELLRKHPVGAKVKMTVLRGGERLELMLPIQ
jgi:hypothetical protein